jgi:aromatic ring-cleaving dioxygenase
MAQPWADPRDVIWGFHVHQDLTEHTAAALPASIALQQRTRDWLSQRGTTIDVEAAVRPGYGPHISYAWELRVESTPREEVARRYGAAVLWLALNHGTQLAGYIHPVAHDESLPVVQQIMQEGTHHKFHTVKLGPQPLAIRLDFFLNPPLDVDGGVADTRTCNEIFEEERNALANEGRSSAPQIDVDPVALVDSVALTVRPNIDAASQSELCDFMESFKSFLKGSSVAFEMTPPVDGAPSLTVTFRRDANNGAGAGGADLTFEALAAQVGLALLWLLVNRVRSSAACVAPPVSSIPLAFVTGAVALRGDASDPQRAAREANAVLQVGF